MTLGYLASMETRALFVLLWLFPLPSFAQTGAAFGRLFFTPEARQDLDRQRLSGDQSRPSDTAPGELRIDGVVIGANTRTTIWIDGHPLVEDSKTGKLIIRAEKTDPGKISFQLKASPPLQTQIGARLTPAMIEAIPALKSSKQEANLHRHGQ